jgi:cell volume regulation protein A
MQLAAAILLIGGLVFLAHLFEAVFSRTRIPDVLWLLLIGVALGPVFHRLSPSQFGVVGPAFVSITLVLILFESGLSLQWGRLRRALPGTLALATASFAGEAAVVGLAASRLAHWGPFLAALLGVIVAGNSPSVIVPLAKGLRLGTRTRDILFLESAIGDVASIVLALALLDFHVNGWARWPLTSLHVALGFGGALLLGAAAGLGWSMALRKTRGLQNAMFTTPAFVFVVYGGAELLRANGAIAVLALGILLGNVENTPLVRDSLPAVGPNREETVFLGEIVFLLKTFFFVYIGLSVRFTDLRWLLLGGLLTLLLLPPRLAAVRLTVGPTLPARDAAMTACMVAKGLAAAVLAQLLMEQQLPGAAGMQSTIYGVIFFGILVTSALVVLANRPRGATLMRRLLGAGPAGAAEMPPR